MKRFSAPSPAAASCPFPCVQCVRAVQRLTGWTLPDLQYAPARGTLRAAPRLALLESGSVTRAEIAALAAEHRLSDAWKRFESRFPDG